jgi:hypothetical protein
MRAALVLAVVALAACGGEKKSPTTFAQDIETICGAPTAVGVDKLNPAERQSAMGKHIAAKIHHPEAISLFEAMAYAAPAERVPMFRKAVEKAGVKSCEMLDQMEKEWAEGVKAIEAQKAAAATPDASAGPAIDASAP